MKKYIDLSQTSVELPTKALELAERAVTKEPKKRKQRSARQLRAFRYRGEQFMFVNRDKLTLVCTINKTTKTPEPVIEVPNENARKAMRALTKIIQAENILDGLKHIS